MSASTAIESVFYNRLRGASRTFFWLGLAMTALGIGALVFPAVSTLAVTLFVGWLLLISGVIVVAGAFSIHGTGPFFGALLLGLLSVAAGVFLISNPVEGAQALTLTVGLLFILQGTFEMSFAFEMRPQSGWVAMLISAIASIVIAILIVAGWPAISFFALGILLGVNFISTGLGYILVASALRRSS